MKKPENIRCADCNEINPRWASLSFGNIVCIRCSGFHRKLGVHITKVRSLDFDYWTDELLEFYRNMSIFVYNLGNEKANEYWEYRIPNYYKVNKGNMNDLLLWKFIRDKYLKRLFVPKDTSDPVTIYYEEKSNEKSHLKKGPSRNFTLSNPAVIHSMVSSPPTCLKRP